VRRGKHLTRSTLRYAGKEPHAKERSGTQQKKKTSRAGRQDTRSPRRGRDDRKTRSSLGTRSGLLPREAAPAHLRGGELPGTFRRPWLLNIIRLVSGLHIVSVHRGGRSVSRPFDASLAGPGFRTPQPMFLERPPYIRAGMLVLLAMKIGLARNWSRIRSFRQRKAFPSGPTQVRPSKHRGLHTVRREFIASSFGIQRRRRDIKIA